MKVPVYDRVVKCFNPVYPGQEPSGYVEVPDELLVHRPAPRSPALDLLGPDGAVAAHHHATTLVAAYGLVPHGPGPDPPSSG